MFLKFEVGTHPLNSIFSVVVRIYKIIVIDEAFFSSLQLFPWKVTKFLFSVFLLNTERNSFNTIMQLINLTYTWKNKIKRIKAIQ